MCTKIPFNFHGLFVGLSLYIYILVYSIQHHSSYQTKFKEKWIKMIVLRTFSYDNDNDNKCALKRLTQAVRLAAHVWLAGAAFHWGIFIYFFPSSFLFCSMLLLVLFLIFMIYFFRLSYSFPCPYFCSFISSFFIDKMTYQLGIVIRSLPKI